jgi:hypothetical protein
MARVFAAYDAGLDRTVAIKLVSVRSPAMVERFLREARDTARCVHPNIVVVHEIGQHHQVPYMVLEHVVGSSLDALVRAGPPPLAQIIDLMLEVARALECAHAHGIIHRDLKPSNILVTHAGVAKVCDFGVAAYARALTQDGPGQEPATLASSIAGTLPYMAPEQLAHGPLDARVDLWSFGVVLFQLVVGERPFAARSASALRAELADLARPAPSVTRLRVPPLLRWLIARCLEKRRSRRLRTASEAVSVLSRIAAELTPGRSAISFSELQRPVRWSRRARWAAGAGALAIAAGAVIAAGAGTASMILPLPVAPVVAPPAAIDPAAPERLVQVEREVERLRGAGHAAAAEQVFATFVAQPDNAGVRAEAWLHRADRELAERAFDAALRSYASGYVAATRLDDDHRALVGVAGVHLARWRWDALAQVEPLLAPLPDQALRTEVHDRVALANRRADARAVADPEIARAGKALLAGTPLPGPVVAAGAVDLDGDGAPELVTVALGELTAWRIGGGMRLLWRIAIDDGARGACVGSDRGGALIAVLGARTSLVRADADGAHPITTTGPGARCTLVDLDGDGQLELYLTSATTLIRLSAAGVARGWIERRFELGSVIGAVVGADLDGDGRPELAIAAGEWRAYDVRVLRSGPRGELALVDRIRIGRVSELAVARRSGVAGAQLIARKDSAWPSAVYLPAGDEAAGRDGIYVLALGQDRLAISAMLPDRMPLTTERTYDGMRGARALVAIDLDGDGHDELLASGRHPGEARPFTEVWARTSAGWRAAVIDGVIAVAGVARPAGGAATVAQLVEGGEVTAWLLGDGAQPVPPIEVAQPPASAAPTAVAMPAWQREIWGRADVMSQLGATQAALEAFEQLARLAPPAVQGRALEQVLALRRRAGQPIGPAWDAVAEHAATGSRAQAQAALAAAASYAADVELAAAARALDAALAAPAAMLDPGARVAAQAQRAALTVRATRVFESAALGPAWRIDDPIAIRYDVSRGQLVLDGLGQGAIATVALARGEGPIGFAFTGTITRAEWGAGLAFRLAPRGAPAGVGLSLKAVGGGQIYELIAKRSHGGSWSLKRLGRHADVDGRVAIAAEIMVVPDLGRARWTVTADGVRHTGMIDLPVTSGAAWELSITADGQVMPTRMALALDELTVSGLVPEAADGGPRHEAMRALASGDHRRAVAASARGTTTGAFAALVRALVGLRDGDAAAAGAALRELRNQLSRGRAIATLARIARVDDAAHGATVRSAAGVDAAAVMGRAWQIAAVQHPGDEAVQRALTRELRDVVVADVDADTAQLLVARARARVAVGDTAGAIRDLDQVVRRGAAVGADRLEAAHLERARIAARRGAVERARRAVTSALAVSPWPESTADLVMLDPALAPLATQPGWDQVRALGRPIATR